MGKGLSIKGLLSQARGVLIARWIWLLAAALVWAVVGLQVHEVAMQMAMAGDVTEHSPWPMLIALIDGVIAAVGAALMTGIVVRTGLPRRPLGVATLHVAFAAATVLLALLIHGFGGMVLRDAAWRLTERGGYLAVPLGYVAAFVGPFYQFGLFVLLGMAIPAAMERLTSPWQTAVVSLKLTEGHRLWLAIIAVLWSVALLAPVYGLTLLAPMLNHSRPMLLVGQMLTAAGIGVLYLELRRIYGSPALAAST